MFYSKLKIWLKEALITLLLLAVALNVISYLRSPLQRGDMLDAIELKLINGDDLHIDRNRSEPLMIHFWATWCPTCTFEADHIESLARRFDVVTIAVKSGNDTKLKRYMNDNGYTFAVANDPEGRLAERFNISAYPTTFIYAPSGSLRFGEVGYTSVAGLYLRMLLAPYL